MNSGYFRKAWLRIGAILLTAILAGGGSTAWSQPASDEPPRPPDPAVAAAPNAPPAPAAPSGDDQPTTERKTRLHQVVAVGGDARVGKSQTADEVVVVKGDAAIEGDVEGDLVVIFGRVRVTGRVDGDVVVVLGEAEIDGEVTGDTALVLTKSHIRSHADLRGDVVAVGMPPEIDPSAKIKGTPEIVSFGPLVRYFDWGKDYLFQGLLLLRPFPPRLAWVWIVAGVFLVFHLVVALLFGGPLRGCMETLREQPARSFVIGLLACILVGPLSLLLSFTVVATPLIWLAFAALCVFGRVAAYGATGAALGRASGAAIWQQPVPAVLLGSILYYVVYMVPAIGFLVFGLALPWGVGAALIRLFDALRRERQPGTNFGAGAGGGSPGNLAAASALATGEPGPATRGIEVEPPLPVADPSYSAGPAITPPPVPPIAPLSGPAPSAASTGSPPLVTLSAVETAALPRVGFWPRFAATAIDIGVVAFANALMFGEVRAFWLFLGVYHFAFWGWKATTLGGSILGLRVIRLDGRPVDWPTAAVRVLGSVVSLLPLGIGFFWASWDDQGQSWHDRIAGTTIVRSDRRVSLV